MDTNSCKQLKCTQIFDEHQPDVNLTLSKNVGPIKMLADHKSRIQLLNETGFLIFLDKEIM